VQQRDELRQHVARVLEERADSVLNDALALFPFSGTDPADTETLVRIGGLVLGTLIAATRAGDVDARSSSVVELRRTAGEKRLLVPQLFALVYIMERAALDELALDESLGASSESWPTVAQIARRASFDVLAAFAERLSQEAGADALSDTLTTLHTRQILVPVLDKELQRSERFGHPFALILFDVDHLSAINEAHGFGFGDRLLERLGIVLGNYFRVQDWVCRTSADKFAVLLPETAREHAELLAERVRVTVQDRMALRDYRSEEQVTVTVSAGLVVIEAVDASVRADRILREAEQAVHLAKHGGRNRVATVAINVQSATPRTRDAEVIRD
jgi:diguanylate cyclase (GGDEF)-like protein